MLTDVLSKNALQVPQISGTKALELQSHLFPGSSIANPIDFLATGTAAQLGIIIDYCEKEFDNIDAMVVIFGSPGLFGVAEVYDVLLQKIQSSHKPIYPVLPSVVNVKDEILSFTAEGQFAFFDEVLFGKALAKVAQARSFSFVEPVLQDSLQQALRQSVKNSGPGYLPPGVIQEIFDLMQIPRVAEYLYTEEEALSKSASSLPFPVVMKVVGPVHKTDVGGVRLHIENAEMLFDNYRSLMQIEGAKAVLVQPMLQGRELYVGVKKEGDFGHSIVFGLGGVFIEILKDFQLGLAPLQDEEIRFLLQKLKAYPLFKTYRGKKRINPDSFVRLIRKISDLVAYLPEIEELDINPLIADAHSIVAVDARIRMA